MELVKDLSVFKIFFHDDHKIIESSWHGENEDLNTEEVKQFVVQLANIIKAYSPIFILANDYNRAFPFKVEIQNWIASTLASSAIEVGVKKYAIVMPQDFISQLSTEQTGDEAGQIPFELQYFNDRETALTWLMLKPNPIKK